MDDNELKKHLEPFKSRCNCAQTVLLAFQKEMDLDEQVLLGMGLGFGGGIARTGQLCGAVSGGVMALGRVCSLAMEDPGDAKELTIKVVQQFLEDFREAQGTLYCSELLDGLDLRPDEGREQFKQTGLHERVCEPAVSTAITAAGKLIGIIREP